MSTPQPEPRRGPRPLLPLAIFATTACLLFLIAGFVYHLIREERPAAALWLTLVTILLIASASAVIGSWWRAETARHRTQRINDQLDQARQAAQFAAELRASEDKYRVLADYSADWEYWIGPDGRYRYVSPACEAICGHPPEAFTADPGLMERILHPDDIPTWQAHSEEVAKIETPGRHALLLRIVSRDDGERWIEHLCTAVFDAEGGFQGRRGVNRDVTERVRAEQAVQAGAARQRQLLAGMPQLIWTCRADGPCDYLGPQWLAYTGLPEAPQLGYGWLEQLHPDDRQPTLNRWQAAVPQGAAFDIEFRLRRHDGLYRWFRTRAVPLRDEAGRVVQWIGSHTDIDESKQAAALLARYREQLEAEVAARTTELAIANRDLEGFSYSVSHDLRAPLRAINGFVAILEEEYAPRLDAEGLRLLGVVSGSAKKMGELIDDILAFSRAGRLELERVEVDMNALVAEAWAGLAAERGERPIEFHPADLPPAWGDPHALRQVWQNLLGNAIKFTQGREPAVIEVTAEVLDGHCWYAVRDNGAGFNPDYANKLFVLFQRLHGMDEYEGTGVGLAIVKRFVQKHGGQVEVEGALGQGAVFRFSLPRAGA